MITIYSVFYIICVVIILINYIKQKNNYSSKRSMILFSASLILLISLPISFLAFIVIFSEYEGADFFITMGMLISYFIGFCVFLVVLLTELSKIKQNKDKSFIQFILPIIIISIILICMTAIYYNIKVGPLNEIKEKSIPIIEKQLDDKYGEGNCTINKLKGRYYTPIMSPKKELTGYEVTFTCKNIKNIKAYYNIEDKLITNTYFIKSFIQSNKVDQNYIKNTINSKVKSLNDYLSQYFEIGLESKFTSIYDYEDKDLLSNYYGKIPTLEEFYELIINHEVNERINIKDFRLNGKDVLDYLEEVAYKIIEYYNNDIDNFTFTEDYHYKKVKITKESIDFYSNDTKVKSISRVESNM